MSDVLIVGEALVEFASTEAGATLREAHAFEKGIGGAAARLAIGLARLGVSSGFVGRVGDDPFGHFLADGLAAEGVDVSQLGFERRARTGLIFTSPAGRATTVGAGLVPARSSATQPDRATTPARAATVPDPVPASPGPRGDRREAGAGEIGTGRPGRARVAPTDGGDALFFRHPSAGIFLSPGHVNPAYIKAARAIVYSSSGLMGEPSRSAVFKALAIAQSAGLLRVYHVNLHLSLWESESEARYGLGLGLGRAAVAVLSRDELEFLSGVRDVAEGTQALWRDSMRMLVVTLGADGCAYRTAAGFGETPGYPVEAIASDNMNVAFLASLLAKLVRRNFSLETL